ncbi:MAG: aldose 1-epimerase family protein [Planctomycetota bacterium]
MPERFHQILIDASQSIGERDWSVRSSDLGFDGDWSISLQTLRGGRQEGVQLLEIDAGALKVTLVPTRGMGITQVEHRGERIGWHSPSAEHVHPSQVRLESRGGLGWLEGFNEWLVRCGLEWAGGPGPDRFITNTGAEAEMDLTLHGRIANIPASRLEVIVEPGDPPLIRVRGVVHERCFYGPRLELESTVSIEVGTDRLLVDDRVINRAANHQEMQLLYHINYGSPLLSEGARFLAPVRRVMPINEHAASAVDCWDIYRGPTPGFVEEVYCLEPIPDATGQVPVLLQSAAGDRGVLMHQRVDQLPCLTLWKSTGAEDDGYVTGIEPGCGYPHNRRIERAHGRVPTLGAGEARSFRLEFGFLEGHDALRPWVEAIEASNEKWCRPEHEPMAVDDPRKA